MAAHTDDPRRPRTDTDRLNQARRQIAEAAPDGVPPLWALRTLKQAEALPHYAGGTIVLDWERRSGDPHHGAMRTDDHVSAYEADVPLTGSVDPHKAETVDLTDGCPQCGHDRGEFSYSTYHHIAGHAGLSCGSCGHEILNEAWD